MALTRGNLFWQSYDRSGGLAERRSNVSGAKRLRVPSEVDEAQAVRDLYTNECLSFNANVFIKTETKRTYKAMKASKK
ncbi:hypothetical protein TYRP_017547 [Tyrophagus putrescentiae]|nr:hypothetical protein TYRP_017547 [Tyrophagus putrescentiae]